MKKYICTKIFKKASIALVAFIIILSTTTVTSKDQLPKFTRIDSVDTPCLQQTNIYQKSFSSDILDLRIKGDRFYAYNANDPTGVLHEGPVYFYSDDPGNITLLKQTSSLDFITGATWALGKWYGCEYGIGRLWTIDEITGDMTLIGGGGINLNGLAYDHTTSIMYGASRTSLYIINMSTGDQTLVGSFNIIDGMMIGIACDGNGTLYGEDLTTDSLFSVNPLTGTATIIGPLGMDINWAQDMAYDINGDILYLSAFTRTPQGTPEGGALYTCNVTTGQATKVGTFQGESCITGFAIPYNPPPEIPQQPDGPSNGITEKEYTFSTISTDPEDEQISYMWDWGDGSPQEWTDYYDSGVMVYNDHSWTDVGIYEIKVKSKDIHEKESDWSISKTINIVDDPILEIGTISGNLLKINAVIKNNGYTTSSVNWSITLTGGLILFGKKTTGRILNIPAESEVIVKSKPILGFGKTIVTVTAEKPGISSDTKEVNASVFLFFIRY